ncbi:unnamed protein product [Cylindrotheca closterium]|uniref:Uncharacterized protein n=1 Tax=Cylindrotheca closterium TaxID=2856 RepID=A0AAD2CCI4_9STRA|nr:unnamed protein product [Cylindrotheca closterium]
MDRLETERAAEQAVERFDDDSKDVTIPETIPVDSGGVTSLVIDKNEDEKAGGDIKNVHMQATTKKEDDKNISAGGPETRIQTKDMLLGEDVLASRVAIVDEELGEIRLLNNDR